MKPINIIFSAGLDAWHFQQAQKCHTEKELVTTIADQFYASARFPSYSAAVAAAAGVVQYEAALAAGELLLRQARRKLDATGAVDISCGSLGV